MNDFDYEVLERKRLAQQSKRKKNGSKSRKCSLPSDRMTQKQWKEVNGQVMSYNLNKPMLFDEFKQLPKDLQEKYIKQLQQKYNASQRMISTMMGINHEALHCYCKSCGLNVSFSKRGVSGKKSADVLLEWERFIKGCADGSTQSDATPAVAEHEQQAENDSAAPSVAPKKAMQFNGFTLHFSGEFDRNALCNTLAAMLYDGQKVMLSITCEVVT